MHLKTSTTSSTFHKHARFVFLQRSYSVFLSGRTPLHWSSEKGHLGVCQFLVEKGADVNATENEYDILPHAYAYDHALLGFVLFATFLLTLRIYFHHHVHAAN